MAETTRDVGHILSQCFNNIKLFLRVGVVDSSGTQIDTFGGGSQYEDGAAVAAGQKGTVAMGTDGSNLQFLKTTSDGTAEVKVTSGVTSSEQSR
jgi:hypothetical protein